MVFDLVYNQNFPKGVNRVFRYLRVSYIVVTMSYIVGDNVNFFSPSLVFRLRNLDIL